MIIKDNGFFIFCQRPNIDAFANLYRCRHRSVNIELWAYFYGLTVKELEESLDQISLEGPLHTEYLAWLLDTKPLTNNS